ncbi:MAG TPA: hypothetical protein VEA99_13140, partial [Gemmatimonadaceae bacterium]|nr:hypothetical protein [Gemmatimonadaceae bacterium]
EPFGWLAFESDLSSAHAWTDGLIPGVRPDANDDSGVDDAGGSATTSPVFERRWTVWGYAPTAGAAPAVKVVAVSVIYREPHTSLRREVVAYTQFFDSAAFALNLTANQ